MAAIPLACAAIAVPEGAGLVGFFVRKERKEHGLQRWVEGPVEAGDELPGRGGHGDHRRLDRRCGRADPGGGSGDRRPTSASSTGWPAAARRSPPRPGLRSSRWSRSTRSIRTGRTARAGRGLPLPGAAALHGLVAEGLDHPQRDGATHPHPRSRCRSQRRLSSLLSSSRRMPRAGFEPQRARRASGAAGSKLGGAGCPEQDSNLSEPGGRAVPQGRSWEGPDAPSRIRTCGLLLRRESLYPAELSGPSASLRLCCA